MNDQAEKALSRITAKGKERPKMVHKLSRRKFFRFLGTGLASISVAVMVPSFGFSAVRKKGKLKKAEPSTDSTKRAELRKLLQEMRTDLIRCKKALIARKKAGRPYGHLASRLHRKQRTVRNYHIALSELRGKRRNEIERPRNDNLPCEEAIARIKKRYS
jgi:hypothetical protein